MVATLFNNNYSATPVTGTLIISKATPTIIWSNPSDIQEGVALSSTQLNATSSVGGSFDYTPDEGTILALGTHQLSTTFTPTDTNNYNLGATTTVSLVVSSVPDTTPPVISSLSASSTPTSASVSWTTNEPANSQIEYGTTT